MRVESEAVIMKSDKKKYLYICDNCDHEFYLKKLAKDRPVECSRCGERTAYCDFVDVEVSVEKEDGDSGDPVDGFDLMSFGNDTNFD